MPESLPLRKYIKVWIKKRKNNPKNDGTRSISYTLEWVEYGRRSFKSLGAHATLSFAKNAAAAKERELNSPRRRDEMKPITWADFTAKYLGTTYPGHDLPKDERKAKEKGWEKSLATYKREKYAVDNFARLVKPAWCHDLGDEHRIKFTSDRLGEVGSAATVDAELRALRLLFNLMEEWGHRSKNSNPFAGKGKASVGTRRRREK